MPVIQQERGIKTVAGLPARWGRRAYRELSDALRNDGPNSDRYRHLAALLDEVTAAPLPLDATDAHLCVLAERYATDCTTHGAFITDPAALRARLASICRGYGIEPPDVTADNEAIMRCNDPLWWRRALRKAHGRRFEAAAIRLGFVSVRAGAYVSDETVARRMAQKARNRAALDAVMLENEEGARFTKAELASKGTSNMRIRRGELMLRMAGCENVAIEAGHVGVFFTVTAPAKYHAVLQKSGTVNPCYNGATPLETHGVLQKNWEKSRAALHREGIKPYGFRVAEPHHDGCPHWHGLVFMPPEQVDRFCEIVKRYALLEDGDEPGARQHRATFERIKGEKGTAAGYLAKYISKNIDDDSEDAHDEVIGPDGQPVKIAMRSDGPTKASQRVDAWASVWGIRQFQPIGMPPVTVYREFRRIKAEAVANASPTVRMAWEAAQRVESVDPDTGESVLERAANFGNYIRAQGGVCQGRDYRIAIATEPGVIAVGGRYGFAARTLPVGVYERIAPDVVYASVRYLWKEVGAGREHRDPWSPVNNCTPTDWPGRPKAGDEWFRTMPEPGPVAEFSDEDWYASDEFARYWIPPEDVAAIELAGERRQPIHLGEMSDQGRAAFAAQAAYAAHNATQGKSHG